MSIRSRALAQLAQLRATESLGSKVERQYVMDFQKRAMAAMRGKKKVKLS
jgi:hypothetical protein